MTLVLEIEYLAGVSFAAIGPDSAAPDWPPQPDRIFSALVATWAARGERRQEAKALEWLERLAPPRVLAAAAEPRTGAIVFVPPNDPRSDRQKHAKGVLPALRNRQPRRFPATRPHDPIVRLLWLDAEPGDETFAALEGLARDTAYVGHSASLTRCRFVLDCDTLSVGETAEPERCLYSGRFAELRRDFDAGRRSLPGAPVSSASQAAVMETNVFGKRWLLLEHVAGQMPDVRACALVARSIRRALVSEYQRIAPDGAPEIVSGLPRTGGSSRTPHIGIVPLTFTGFPYADGHVLGFALVPPDGSAILDDEDFRRVVRSLAAFDAGQGRRVVTVTAKEGTPTEVAFSIGLSPTFEATRRSLDPVLHTRSARTFGTVTPVVLDRHLKERGESRQREIEELIGVACHNTGLPKPERVVVDRHSAVEGAPSAYPSGKAPSWMRWRLPQPLASRQLTHATIRFSTPVSGPVILGAGRFLGLGLCRPLDEV